MSRSGKRKQVPQGSGVPKHPSKQPRSATHPADEKVPRALNIDNSEVHDRCLVYRFADFDPDSPPGFKNMDHAKWLQVMKSLADYETQKLRTIWGSTDNGCRIYELDDAHDNIVKRIMDLDRTDETAVRTLRVGGPVRVYGFLREHVFHVLWLDPLHEMWPSAKKNT